MNIAGLDKAEVLAALFNGSTSFCDWQIPSVTSPIVMSVAKAKTLLHDQLYFDYIDGRPIKIDFADGDELDTRLYNRNQGAGHAEQIINSLRNQNG